MSIKHTQVLDRDTLNRAFVSKSATGTQIMAGSLRLLGGLTIDGATNIKSLTAGALTVSSVNASGTITATTFSGSGASLTNLPATSLTGTINIARMPTNVLRTDLAQTVTTNKTFSTAANLYFAGGTTYLVNTAGSATLNALETKGNIMVTGGQLDMLSAHKEDKIRLNANSRYNIGTEADHIRYGAIDVDTSSIGHKFYRGGGELIAQIGYGGAGVPASRLDSRFHGSLSVAQSLEVEGELKAGGVNEFPDPLLASNGTSYWPQTAGGTYTTDIQTPSDTGALLSIKITATDARAYMYSSFLHKVSPGEWITFSAYAFTTASGKQGRMTIRWKDSAGLEVGRTDIFQDLTTSWKRYRATGQAPATATQFDVAITAELASTIVYWSAFQVERGRTMTAFKPFGGGNAGPSFFGAHLKLGVDGEIHSSHNNNFILKDHKNGNITLSAAGSSLYLGYQNTTVVRLSSDLVDSGGTNIIASSGGKLYYQGSDIDGRYLRLASGGNLLGDLTISKSNAWFTIDSPSTGADGVEQAAGISIGESGYKGTAAIHITYTGGGQGHIGMGAVDAATSIPLNKAIGLNYTDQIVRFYDTPQVNGNPVWHTGNDGATSGLDADFLDGLHGSSYMRTDANTATTGDITLGGGLKMGSNTLSVTGSYYNLKTSSGDLEMGMQNTSWAHFRTSATAGFYFYNNIAINGNYVVTNNRSITAGTGLSGGGTLSADRTLAFDTTWGDARYALSGHNHNNVYLDIQYAVGVAVDVDSMSNGTKIFLGSSSGWLNRGPTGHNGSALFSMNTHAGSYFNQLWFDTSGDSFYHRSIDGGTIKPWRKVWTEGNFTPGNYALTSHNHDTVYVKKSGDTMTGSLTITGSEIINPSAGDALTLGRVSGTSSIKSTDSWLMLDSGTSGIGLNWYTDAPVIIARNVASRTGVGTASPTAKFHVDNGTNTMDGFYVNTGLTPGTQTLFEHKLNSVATPYRIQKSAYAGTSSKAGILNLRMDSNTVGVGSNLFFTANSSTGVEREYAGLGGIITTNTNGAENGSLELYTMRAGAVVTAMTIASTGNVGIGTSPSGSYKLNISGDAHVSGWVRVGGTTGLYFQSYGGGWHMTDTAWIRAYGSKPVLADRMRTALLEVGAGETAGSAADLTVTASALNYRDNLYVTNSAVGIGKTSPVHPLDVKAGITHQGINIQTGSDSLTNGLSFQNSGGTYAWHMARTGTNASPDLVFYGGSSATMSSLSERLRMKNGGGVVITSAGTIGLNNPTNAALLIESGGVQLALDPNEFFFTGSGDNYIGTIGTGDLNFYLGGASRVKFNNNGTTTFTGAMTVSSSLTVSSTVSASSTVSGTTFINAAGNGNGTRYWASTAYSTYMSSTTDPTHGGRLSWVSGDDYNMYFKMTSSNRGFAFSNPSAGGVNAQIEGNGRVNSKVGFRADKFEMAYNATEDSLDFIYHG